MQPLVRQLHTLDEQVEILDREIKAWHKANETGRRLATIPGIGILTAAAIAATVPDPSFFKSSREFAAWLGLTPRQNSSGGKIGLVGYRRKETPIFDGFSSPAPRQCCATPAQRQRLEPIGRGSAITQMSSPSRSPTRTRGLHGACSQAA
jgi:hypothetical protein